MGLVFFRETNEIFFYSGSRLVLLPQNWSQHDLLRPGAELSEDPVHETAPVDAERLPGEGLHVVVQVDGEAAAAAVGVQHLRSVLVVDVLKFLGKKIIYYIKGHLRQFLQPAHLLLYGTRYHSQLTKKNLIQSFQNTGKADLGGRIAMSPQMLSPPPCCCPCWLWQPFHSLLSTSDPSSAHLRPVKLDDWSKHSGPQIMCGKPSCTGIQCVFTTHTVCQCFSGMVCLL